jgi:hypothetical protein
VIEVSDCGRRLTKVAKITACDSAVNAGIDVLAANGRVAPPPDYVSPCPRQSSTRPPARPRREPRRTCPTPARRAASGEGELHPPYSITSGTAVRFSVPPSRIETLYSSILTGCDPAAGVEQDTPTATAIPTASVTPTATHTGERPVRTLSLPWGDRGHGAHEYTG